MPSGRARGHEYAYATRKRNRTPRAKRAASGSIQTHCPTGTFLEREDRVDADRELVVVGAAVEEGFLGVVVADLGTDHEVAAERVVREGLDRHAEGGLVDVGAEAAGAVLVVEPLAAGV